MVVLSTFIVVHDLIVGSLESPLAVVEILNNLPGILLSHSLSHNLERTVNPAKQVDLLAFRFPYDKLPNFPF